VNRFQGRWRGPVFKVVAGGGGCVNVGVVVWFQGTFIV
jgi:hypothetical protein